MFRPLLSPQEWHGFPLPLNTEVYDQLFLHHDSPYTENTACSHLLEPGGYSAVPSADTTLTIPWWPTSTHLAHLHPEPTLQSRSTQHRPTPQPRSPAAKPCSGGLSLGKSEDPEPHPRSLDEGSPSSVLPKHREVAELKPSAGNTDQSQRSRKHWHSLKLPAGPSIISQPEAEIRVVLNIF